MNKIIVNGKEYEIVDNYNDAISIDLLEKMITEYFDDFDYILGDWAYNKLRLKGFYNSNNKNVKSSNDVAMYRDYIKNYCAYGCKYFLIKKSN